MSNNDIFRSLRYTFDINDFLMIEIFGMAGLEVDRPTVSNWLKKEDDDDFKPLYDKDLAAFLNGFIILKRGKKEGNDPVNEKSLSNNQVLRKLKIALSLIDEDMLNMLKSVNFRLSKHELSAFFRNPTQSQYRDCKDQVLRNFLKGLQVTYRPS
ncbi:YehS family protein [Algoriphagus halophilus]|uniref:Uncharacterized conserved protein YehS, DUF1456 family n=1 Tax=Algoriphagus halophilus TaxID=226505 RepID=A0A1N6E3E8_9BACT|nr:DUF1456 family protein [Algoriphagus halophilus]SIN77538.1 Uncharacterized conserved protein YehS, DUF1456 family [Algoriphagus halophilus]